LAIVKKIVELFGGNIHLEQNQPTGAKFVFTWKK
jgi:signal transduction histidine kinase